MKPLALPIWMCWLATIAFFGHHSTPCDATLISRKVSLDWMLQTTGYAFAGTVAANDARVDPATGRVFTRVVFVNLALAYGKSSGDTIELRLLGGVLNGVAHNLDLQPRFNVGERYIVLSDSTMGDPAGLFLPAVGGPLGVFQVLRAGPNGRLHVHDYWGRRVLGIRGDSIEVLGEIPGRPGRGGPQDLYFGVGPFRALPKHKEPGVWLTERAMLQALAQEIRLAKLRPRARR